MDQQQLTQITKASGTAIYRRGHQLLIADLRTGSSYTAVFVVGLLTGIFAINGVAQIVLAATGSGGLLVAGLIMLALTAVAAFVLKRLLGSLRARNEAQGDDLRILAVLDRRAGTVSDAAGNVFAKLAEFRLVKRFQATSSSRALAAEWPGGSFVIAKGNPFAGGLGNLESEIRNYLA